MYYTALVTMSYPVPFGRRQFLILLLFFRTMTILKGTDLVFCRMSLNFGFSNVLFMSRLKFQIFFRKTTPEVECLCAFSSHHILSGGAWDPQAITAHTNLHHLVEVIGARPLHCQVTIFPSLNAVNWREVTKISSTGKGREWNHAPFPEDGGCLHIIFVGFF